MRRRHTKYIGGIFLLGWLWLVAGAFAADVTMSIQPQLINLMDQAVLKIEFIDTKGEAAQIPPVPGLQIQYQGQSSQISIVNRTRTTKQVHTYLITPERAGDFTIGPILCKYKGGQKTLTARLRVVQPKNGSKTQAISQLVFSRISADRSAPYVHEPFTLTLKVFIRDGVQTDGSFALRGGLPESGLDGDLDWEVTDRDRIQTNGAIYQVYTLQTTVKTLSAGPLVFQPKVQLQLVLPRQRRRSYGFDDPFFGDFFGRQETRAILLDCNRLEIQVQPIPFVGRPDSFTGAVGLFDFDVQVSPKKVKMGEPITIRMRVQGKGNLSQITPPKIKASDDLKVYDARIQKTDDPNELVFEQVVIPKSDRVKEIPPIDFSYFNTKTSDFRTIKKGPFPITVEAVKQQAAQVIAQVNNPMQPAKTEILGHDIVYLKSLPKHWIYRSATPWYRGLPLYLILAIPPLFLFILWGMIARRNALANDVAKARRQKAPKAARQQIAQARRAMQKKEASAFYEAVWNTLADYFGHRLNLPPGEISAQRVATRIPQQAEEITDLFSLIEQRRYGAGHPPQDELRKEMKEILRRTERLLSKCERIKL